MPPNSLKKDFWRASLLVLAYFVSAQLGLEFALVGHAVTLFWPSSGIALAAILLFGYRFLPAVFIGAFFSNLTSGLPLFAVVGMAFGATLEAWLGAYLLKRVTRFNRRLAEVRDVYRLVLYGGAIGSISSAVIGSTCLLAAGAVPLDRYPQTMLFWWMGDALGIILFTPAILAYAQHKPLSWTGARIGEAALLLLVLTLLTPLVFGYFDTIANLAHFGMFVLFPVVVWAALSFNQRFVSGLLILMFLIAMAATLLGMGPFVSGDLSGVIDLWLYSVFMTILGVSVSALNYQRNHAMNALQASKDALSRAQLVGGVGSWQIDLLKNHLEWSDETYRIFGMKRTMRLNYELFLERVHPDDHELLDRAWKNALRGHPYDIEHRILVDGKTKWVREQATIDLDPKSGEAVFAIGTVHDITVLKEEESALRLAARVFESSGEAILITDANALVVAVNHAFVEMSGFRSEEVMGRNPRLLASGRHDAEFYRAMWDDIGNHGYWQGEIWDKHKSGRVYPKWMSITAVRDTRGDVVNYVSIARDTTEQTEAEKNIHFLAYYDVLTGLPNRTLLRDRLGQMIAVSHRDKQQFALLFMDLDRFKYINDSMGHSVGDRLLQAVALRIQAQVRDEDTVARLGGDEFIVLLRETAGSGAAAVAKKLLEALATPYDLDGHMLSTQASIGISIFPDSAHDADTLIKSADMAMYCAKEEGRNNYQFFRQDMNFRVELLFSMEKDLRLALERGEFVLHYQPQADLSTGKLCGVEALIRWHHPEKGPVSPAEFIPVAEETGQIVTIGEWVLRTACAQMMEWRKQGQTDLTMAVNLSMRQLRQPMLVELVKSALAESGLEPRHLELEITEGIMMGDNKIAMNFLSEMHELGVQLSIDDFGTGFSSLNYLKKLPVHKLKIDQSFIRDIETDESDAAIIRSIISLGHRLNLRVIAEGVETQEQLDFLRIRGCDEMQGYFYARPMPAAECTGFIFAPRNLM
ncbi:MAG: EAL domain-containing protein [Nitrosomonadales bacterium]|nr:EAL domain-containing protein [Nitrosomonadales bacterium]